MGTAAVGGKQPGGQIPPELKKTTIPQKKTGGVPIPQTSQKITPEYTEREKLAMQNIRKMLHIEGNAAHNTKAENLQYIDADGDQQIDLNEAWVDSNQNGVREAGEESLGDLVTEEFFAEIDENGDGLDVPEIEDAIVMLNKGRSIGFGKMQYFKATKFASYDGGKAGKKFSEYVAKEHNGKSREAALVQMSGLGKDIIAKEWAALIAANGRAEATLENADDELLGLFVGRLHNRYQNAAEPYRNDDDSLSKFMQDYWDDDFVAVVADNAGQELAPPAAALEEDNLDGEPAPGGPVKKKTGPGALPTAALSNETDAAQGIVSADLTDPSVGDTALDQAVAIYMKTQPAIKQKSESAIALQQKLRTEAAAGKPPAQESYDAFMAANKEIKDLVDQQKKVISPSAVKLYKELGSVSTARKSEALQMIASFHPDLEVSIEMMSQLLEMAQKPLESGIDTVTLNSVLTQICTEKLNEANQQGNQTAFDTVKAFVDKNKITVDQRVAVFTPPQKAVAKAQAPLVPPTMKQLTGLAGKINKKSPSSADVKAFQEGFAGYCRANAKTLKGDMAKAWSYFTQKNPAAVNPDYEGDSGIGSDVNSGTRVALRAVLGQPLMAAVEAKSAVNRSFKPAPLPETSHTEKGTGSAGVANVSDHSSPFVSLEKVMCNCTDGTCYIAINKPVPEGKEGDVFIKKDGEYIQASFVAEGMYSFVGEVAGQVEVFLKN